MKSMLKLNATTYVASLVKPRFCNACFLISTMLKASSRESFALIVTPDIWGILESGKDLDEVNN